MRYQRLDPGENIYTFGNFPYCTAARRGCEATSDHAPTDRAGADAEEARMSAPDPFDLQRFVIAQAPVFETVLAELGMVHLPQLRGLGHSSRTQFYGVASLEEAWVYLAHPLLGAGARALHRNGARLRRLVAARHLQLAGGHEIPLVDDLVRGASAEGENLFPQALDHWCAGQPDEQTVALLFQLNADRGPVSPTGPLRMSLRALGFYVRLLVIRVHRGRRKATHRLRVLDVLERRLVPRPARVFSLGQIEN
jgi:uncharacterized protein (DUF1810 family)